VCLLILVSAAHGDCRVTSTSWCDKTKWVQSKFEQLWFCEMFCFYVFNFTSRLGKTRRIFGLTKRDAASRQLAVHVPPISHCQGEGTFPTAVCDNKHLNFTLALSNYIYMFLLVRMKLDKCLSSISAQFAVVFGL